MKILRVFVVHGSYLNYRKKLVATTLKTIQDCCNKLAYLLETIVIDKFDKSDVILSMKDLDIDQSKSGLADFDCRINQLNIEKISNFLKQKDALEKIASSKNEGNEVYYMIIEDDCIILQEFIKNMNSFLENPKQSEWDILFLCLSQKTDNIIELKNTRENIKILPSKEAYCITPDAAKNLLCFLQKIRYYYRLQLSLWIHETPSIRSMYLPERISVEGSKIGIVPSTTNDNNTLIYNKDYMKIFNMLTEREPFNIDDAISSYSSAESMKSCDIMHIYGVILYKVDRKNEAKEMFESAIDELLLKDGLLTKTSEILNNAININGLCQNDLDKSILSKYENITFAKK
jgi:GR25 family glycosyltransferase involved in LPS biosynthesis